MTSTEKITATTKAIQVARPLVEIGAAKWDRFSLVGIASDGVEVLLGSIHTSKAADTLVAYLSEHPTPDTW